MFEKRKKSIYPILVKIFLPVALIAIGGVALAYFKATAPTFTRKPPKRQVRLVEVNTVDRTAARTYINAMGTVVPSKEVTLKARVSGSVVKSAEAFVPGGHITKDSVILTLDQSDHIIKIKKAESSLENAKASLAIEQGSQVIAREELRLLSESSPEDIPQTDLILRKPQLKQAMAAVASAEADLRQARLELDRTMIKAPFNALIIDRNVNTGTYVSPGETVATIVGTDEYWVEAVVPLDKVSMIDLNYDGGCPVTITSQSGSGSWEGRVVRVAGKLNETSRMATVIVGVSDPLGYNSNKGGPRLMIDDYVNVEITGRVMSDIIEIPRTALRDGDTVWVCSNDSLDIRPVTVAWKSKDKVYIEKGISTGENLVISDLSAPIQGMALKINKNTSETEKA